MNSHRAIPRHLSVMDGRKVLVRVDRGLNRLADEESPVWSRARDEHFAAPLHRCRARSTRNAPWMLRLRKGQHAMAGLGRAECLGMREESGLFGAASSQKGAPCASLSSKLSAPLRSPRGKRCKCNECDSARSRAGDRQLPRLDVRLPTR